MDLPGNRSEPITGYDAALLTRSYSATVSTFFSKNIIISAPILAAVVLFVIGGWTMVVWGIFLRTVLGWHSTWLVNSATHLWGKRRFETRDDSRNNGLIAAITFGEGWHNNHHAYPRSARHGLTAREFDVNWLQIRLLEKFGLAKSVYAYDLSSQNEDKVQMRKAA